MSELTVERPAPGLVIYQPSRGFRYAMDPFLLAGWALEGGRPEGFLDVGTGSGVIALLLGRLGIPGEGIDVRPEWISLAQRSARESGLSTTFKHQDIRTRTDPETALGLCNPPYRPAGSGPLPDDPSRAAARYELNGSLAEIVPALCRAASRVAMVVPARRADEAARLMLQAARPLRRRVWVDDALALLEGQAGAHLEQDDRVAARINGEFSPWVRALYARLGARLGGSQPSAVHEETSFR